MFGPAASWLLAFLLGWAGEKPPLTLESVTAESLRYREDRDQLRDRLRDAATPFGTVLAALHSERVELRRSAAEAAKRRADPGSGAEYLRALASERDVAVAYKLAVSLASHPEVQPNDMRDLLRKASSPTQKQAFEQYMRAKIQLVMDGLVHGGVLSGFYQGQFQPLYQLGDDMSDRLAAMANDERLNHTVRQLAIMALNESGDPQLPNKLKPLIIDVVEEVNEELTHQLRALRPIGDNEYLRWQQVQLSRYARYSLAKAGYPESVREKIREFQVRLENTLDLIAPRALRDLVDMPYDQLAKLTEAKPKNPEAIARVDALRQAALGAVSQSNQFFLADLLFEIAYHYQQLKRYDDCIHRYRFLCFLFEQTAAGNSQCQSARYNLACIFALRGEKEKALDELEAAVAIGYFDFEWAMEDRDLASIRDTPRFRKLVGIGG